MEGDHITCILCNWVIWGQTIEDTLEEPGLKPYHWLLVWSVWWWCQIQKGSCQNTPHFLAFIFFPSLPSQCCLSPCGGEVDNDVPLPQLSQELDTYAEPACGIKQRIILSSGCTLTWITRDRGSLLGNVIHNLVLEWLPNWWIGDDLMETKVKGNRAVNV